MSAITDRHEVMTAAMPHDKPQSGARAVDLVWLTWRQHRSAITASVVIAGLLTGAMVYLADRIATINAACGNAVCAPNSSQADALSGQFGILALTADVAIAVLVMPLLIGVFLGAPLLAREHEQRTLLLAWSQDITPQRWLWSKLILLGGLTAALTTAVSVASDHLAHVYSIASDESLFSGLAFFVAGVVPLALSVAWFAVSVALGAAFRRTLPAIFTSVVGFFALFFFVQWRYPTFQTPLTTLLPVGADRPGQGPLDHNALLLNGLGGQLVDAAGHPLRAEALEAMCPSQGTFTFNGACLAQNHVYTRIPYQPGSRIPEFHLILNSGYLGLAVVAVVVTWWLVRRTSLSAG
jgi:ABC-type transport system involved in multi-copper enzyme maturation permease subunit